MTPILTSGAVVSDATATLAAKNATQRNRTDVRRQRAGAAEGIAIQPPFPTVIVRIT
jgi:hypothetical protein